MEIYLGKMFPQGGNCIIKGMIGVIHSGGVFHMVLLSE